MDNVAGPLKCYCYGDPHCFSFDGAYANFMGTCKYVFARDACLNGVPAGNPSWEVVINNDRMYEESEMAFVNQVRIYLNEHGLVSSFGLPL